MVLKSGGKSLPAYRAHQVDSGPFMIMKSWNYTCELNNFLLLTHQTNGCQDKQDNCDMFTQHELAAVFLKTSCLSAQALSLLPKLKWIMMPITALPRLYTPTPTHTIC